MIRATPSGFEISANGFSVYLDTWAIIELAKHSASRRARFVDAVHSGVDLLFSEANVLELTGPKEQSFDAVKSFLDQLGPHWVPVVLNPFKVLDHERNGAGPEQTWISTGFVEAFFRNRTAGCLPGSGKIIDMGPDFFRLGVVLDFVANSELLPKRSAEFDDFLRTIRGRRVEYERNPSVLDQQYRTFDSLHPVTFVCGNFCKTLIIESKSHKVKRGDGMDFCHTVMGSAFASFAALDKNWKRRVEALPKPKKIARIYYEPELNQMVRDIELALNRRGASH
jgi:hypothetical protein